MAPSLPTPIPQERSEKRAPVRLLHHNDIPWQTTLCAKPDIRDLDLSFTLVSSWASVAQIASELPVLQRLSLKLVPWRWSSPTAQFTNGRIDSRLRLLSLERYGAFSTAFPNLTEIQLNGTLLSWAEVNGIITQMPVLRSLEMGHNRLSSLSTGGGSDPCDPHPTLQMLNLESNELSEWAHVASSISIMPRYVWRAQFPG